MMMMRRIVRVRRVRGDKRCAEMIILLLLLLILLTTIMADG